MPHDLHKLKTDLADEQDQPCEALHTQACSASNPHCAQSTVLKSWSKRATPEFIAPYRLVAMKATVIAFPGTLCSPDVFKPTAEALASTCDFQPISWMREPEGYKPEDRPTWSIEAIARREARNIKQPVILLGHSTGGAIAAYLAAENPDLARGLILVNTGAHMRRHGDVNKIIQAVQDGHVDDIRAAVVMRSFASPLPDEALAAFRSYAASVSPQAVLQALESQRDLDLTPLLARIRCPTVVVHGVLDQARSKGDAEELAGLVPGAVVRWAECGHTPVFEAPDTVSEAVREIVARLD